MSLCKQCGGEVNCGLNECWCLDLPNILQKSDQGGCRCRTCTVEEVRSSIEKYIAELTKEKREVIKSLGMPKKLIEKIDYEINEEGNFVFTTWYHLRRGNCCGSGCINCAWKT